MTYPQISENEEEAKDNKATFRWRICAQGSLENTEITFTIGSIIIDDVEYEGPWEITATPEVDNKLGDVYGYH